MKVYPGIYRNIREDDKSTPYLFTNKDEYFCFDRKCWDKLIENDSHETDINITREYLANTWGEVKSKAHAEFLIELCASNGISCAHYNLHCKCFSVDHDGLYFWSNATMARAYGNGDKQITIPEPPQQNTNTPEEDFEMKQKDMVLNVNSPEGYRAVINKRGKSCIDHLKECGDNLIFGAADKCSEWPCVGDEVIYDGVSAFFSHLKGKKFKVIGVCKNSAGGKVLTMEHSAEGIVAINNGDWIKKPKTPEEELRGELLGVWNENPCRDSIIDALISKYNITKK